MVNAFNVPMWRMYVTRSSRVLHQEYVTLSCNMSTSRIRATMSCNCLRKKKVEYFVTCLRQDYVWLTMTCNATPSRIRSWICLIVCLRQEFMTISRKISTCRIRDWLYLVEYLHQEYTTENVLSHVYDKNMRECVTDGVL